MVNRWLGWGWIVAVAAGIGPWIAQAGEQPLEQIKPGRLAEKSVTVFPVVIVPEKDMGADIRRRIAEVIGMMLERADMKDVRLSDRDFLPKQGDNIDQAATSFGRFVAEQNLATPYALYCEIHGERERGVDAIRTIVVDTKGNVVHAEEIQSEAFPQSGPMVPKDPMSCCIFIVSRLRGPWNLADPLRSDAPKGKLQENWRKKSGVPNDEELQAIREREAKLRKHLAESSLEICPVHAGQKPAPEATVRLAALLADAGFASVKAVEQGPDLKVEGSPNEQEVLWRTARAARTYFQKHAPASQYVLVADFGMGGTDEGIKVGGVHWFICDQRGDWVMVDYQNSHHGDFQQIEPDSVDDCLELVKIRVKKRLAGAN